MPFMGADLVTQTAEALYLSPHLSPLAFNATFSEYALLVACSRQPSVLRDVQ